MFQRVAFGEVSAFLEGLGHHLTDMTPTEILTLVPLGGLVVAFGLFPGLLLDLFPGPVADTLESAEAGSAIAIPTEVVLGGLGLLAAFILARIVYVAVLARTPALEPETGGRP
jgi:hypothetical protein